MWNSNQYSNYGGSGGYHQTSNYGNSYGGGRSTQNYNRSSQSQGGSSGAYNTSTAPRVFTGHVTKLQDSFGIIDKDVFFQFTVVKGKVPQLNDKVLVEAVFNDVLPFKWHATSVQGLGPGSGGGSSGYAGSRGASSNVQRSSNGSGYHQQPTEHLGRSSGSVASNYRSSQPDYSKSSRYGGSSRYDVSPEKSYSGSSYRNVSSSGYDSRSSGGGRRDATYDFSSGRQDARSNIRGGAAADSRSYRYDREDKRSKDYSTEKVSTRDDYDKSIRQARPAARSRSPQREPSVEYVRSSGYQSRKRSRSRSDAKSTSRYHSVKSRDGSVSSSHRDRSSRERTTGDSFKRVSLRYSVKPPRFALNVAGVDFTEMRRRFEGISVPSNFAHLKFSYQQTFPMGKKSMGLGHLVRYHIMDPSAENPSGMNEVAKIPEDCNSEVFVSVMLMGSQSLDDLYANCCRMSGNSSDNLQHMTKVVSFLMGQKSNKDLELVGGEWSPSVDGEDPKGNPAVLINTAIRVAKTKAGIDLSRCANWYTIAELFFVKPGDKLKDEPDTLQRRVIFVPDIWNLMPSESEWEEIKETYKQFGESKALELEPPPPATVQPTEADSAAEKIFDKVMESSAEDSEVVDDVTASQVEHSTPQNETSPQKGKDGDVGTKTPLTPTSMKVAELKSELASRGLDTKGLKNALVQRLEEAIAGEDESKPKATSNNTTLTPAEAEKENGDENMDQEVQSEEASIEPKASDEVIKAGGAESEEAVPIQDVSDQNMEDATAYEEVTLQPDETEMLDVSEKGEDADLEKKRGSKEDAEKDSDKSGGKEKGVSEFLKEEEDRQKEEAERLANEIREEKERKEREEAERARAKKEAERLEKERKEKEEEERKERERKHKQEQIRKMYQLPEKPHLIVHPPKTTGVEGESDKESGGAKLKSVSYSSLLDKVYAESKEDAFTLEVFAECLYEMLQRDFCYEIYRALEHAPDPEVIKKKAEIARKEQEVKEAAERARKQEEARLKKEEEERIEAERKAKEEGEKAEKEEKEKEEADGDIEESMDTAAEVKAENGEEKNEDTVAKSEEDKEKDDEIDNTGPPSNKRLKSDAEATAVDDGDKVENKKISGSKKEKEESVKKESDDKVKEEDISVVVKKKMVSKTVYPQLLLAFSFFDRSFSGYIKQRDLEECLDALGLGLSKAQLKYLVGKVAKLDMVNYQDLTDEKVEEGASYAFKYYTDNPLGNTSEYKSDHASPSAGSSASVSGDFVQFQGTTVNLRNVMGQADVLQSENDVLNSRVLDLEKDNTALKNKFDIEAMECENLRKKLGETKTTLSQTANSNAHLSRTQESLKRLMKDNAFTLESTAKLINKKLEDLEPKEEQTESAVTSAEEIKK